MPTATLFVTGTDTGVGKTVLAALLVRRLRSTGVDACALKPICSGGRGDARLLRAAQDEALSIQEINPWHFRLPVAPLLAARREGACLRLADVLRHLRRVGQRFEAVVIEGAGGLLSPLGEDFNARDLITALGARVLVVCPNRLGAINQTLLVLAALPAESVRHAHVVLRSPPRPDQSSRSNRAMLAELLEPGRVHALPRLAAPFRRGRPLVSPRVRRMLDALLAECWPARMPRSQPSERTLFQMCIR